jgi:hypothetical protein
LVLGTAVFSSCINDAFTGQNFDLNISGAQLESMMDGSRTLVTVDDYDFKLTVTLFVNNTPKDVKKVTVNSLEVRKPNFGGINLQFNRVPLKSEVYIKVLMEYEGEYIEAESNKITVKKGENILSLTIRGIKVVQKIETQIALLNYNSNKKYTIYEPVSSIEDITSFDGQRQIVIDSYSNSIAFDSNGNLYCVNYSNNINSNQIVTIKRLNNYSDPWQSSTLSSDNIIPSGKITSYLSTIVMAIDVTNDYSYFLLKVGYDSPYEYYLLCCPNLVAQRTSSLVYMYKINYPTELEISPAMAVNGGKIYLALNGKGSHCSLYCIDIENYEKDPTNTVQITIEKGKNSIDLGLENYTGTGTQSITVSAGELSETITTKDPLFVINDIVYDSGCIYALFAQNNLERNDQEYIPGFYRGGLVKVSLYSNEKIYTGLNKQSFNLSGKYISAHGKVSLSSKDHIVPLYNKVGNDKRSLIFTDDTFGDQSHTFHATMEQDLNNYFIMPQKIVAIKPKKLVILDGGIVFYTDNDYLFYKNLSRLVEVDLRNFTISGSGIQNMPEFIKTSFERTDSITIKKFIGTLCSGLKIELEPLKNTSFSGNIFYEDNREIVQTGTQNLYYMGEGSETSKNFTIPSAVIYQAISYGK